jgi:hypothetical protein
MLLEKISKTNLNEAVEFLVQNSVSDPSYMYLFPDEKKRIRNTFWITRALMKILVKFDSGYIIKIKNKIAGLAACIPPEKKITNLMIIKNGFLVAPFILGLRAFMIIMKLIDISDKIGNDYLHNEKHWNIFYFNYDKKLKVKGVEKLLLNEIFRQSVKTKTPVFTQVFIKEQAVFFEKNGFTKAAEIRFSNRCKMECLLKETEIKQPKKAKKA